MIKGNGYQFLIAVCVLYAECLAAQCKCESGDFHQLLNVRDAQNKFTFQAACIAPLFMGQQSIVFCIANNSTREVQVYAEVTVSTTKGGEVNFGKISDSVGANKAYRTGWTGNLAYVFDDAQRAKYGNIGKITKIRVWTAEIDQRL